MWVSGSITYFSRKSEGLFPPSLYSSLSADYPQSETRNKTDYTSHSIKKNSCCNPTLWAALTEIRALDTVQKDYIGLKKLNLIVFLSEKQSLYGIYGKFIKYIANKNPFVSQNNIV